MTNKKYELAAAKPWLPDRAKLDKYIDGIYERAWLTNNGPLVQELTHKLEEYLEVENLLLVANGTLALQIAYHALYITPTEFGAPCEAITTPFTFVATASSLAWEGITPVFVDIDPYGWCLDPALIEDAITTQTRAIVPVHVFGRMCDVELIQEVADNHKLKVIYDASHAFGVRHKGSSILRHGDAATLSFHATKLFHTCEGGAIIFKKKEHLDRARELINFGLDPNKMPHGTGINAKMSELHAAFGLCAIDELEENIRNRKLKWEKYNDNINKKFKTQAKQIASEFNYAYFPLVLHDEATTIKAIKIMEKRGIELRRYFYPSLESAALKHRTPRKLVNSSHISSSIICLPVHSGVTPQHQDEIISLINNLSNL